MAAKGTKINLFKYKIFGLAIVLPWQPHGLKSLGTTKTVSSTTRLLESSNDAVGHYLALNNHSPKVLDAARSVLASPKVAGLVGPQRLLLSYRPRGF